MAAHRPYRAALGVEAALEEIAKNKGRLYAEDVAAACLWLSPKGSSHLESNSDLHLGIMPIRELVRAVDGELVLSQRQTPVNFLMYGLHSYR